MKNYIAAGFQNTVDFELIWDTTVLESLITHHKIVSSEINAEREIHSERDLLIVLLSHMAAGSGSECLASSSRITRAFASHFHYNITLGGTAIRAAMAMEKIGYRSTVHACSLNRHFRALVPEEVDWISSVPDEGDDFHPHVIVQYPSDIHIHAMDLDFKTSRANRVIFTHDPPSMALKISDSFADRVSQARVLLIASYNIINEEKLLKDRLSRTVRIIENLPPDHIVVMEDGCFKDPHMRRIVTGTLSGHIDIFSTNEDELQDRFGSRIDISDAAQVARAVRTVYSQVNVPTLVCHSAHWTLAYGKITENILSALRTGMLMAATRFRMGDMYSRSDYHETADLPDSMEGTAFSQAAAEEFGPEPFVCLPCKDLSFVKNPTTIGLGDSFIGGMLPSLLPPQIEKLARFR